MANIETYREMLQQPWGKIQYELTFAQLAHLSDKTILDFGAGFCLVSEFLAAKNTVTAIELNAEMLFASEQPHITKLQGSIEKLDHFPDQSFDLICCHNVIEYLPISERQAYFQHFYRLLKPGGQLSIIKHNPVGKVLQAVVFSNNVEMALSLLEGQAFESHSFAQGTTYSMEELVEWSLLKLENYYGIRTFYSLQPNSFKTEENWLDNMVKMELAVADMLPYKDISFLQHVWLKKEV